MSKKTMVRPDVQFLLELIPVDAEARVSRAIKQSNIHLREQIRNATGFKLVDGDGSMSLPVKVTNGFPKAFAEIVAANPDPVLWRLILGQHKLGGLINGVQFLLEGWHGMETWSHLPESWRDMRENLERSLEFAGILQQLAKLERVRDELQKIKEDILGAYFYGTNKRIELYWLPIAIIAAMIGAQIEDLAIVVLIHELAHGYTHLGSDIDGGKWSQEGFAFTSLDVKEGLAQFYTEVITEQIAGKSPGAKVAYESLLPWQSSQYRVHKTWFKEEPTRTREIVRATMVAARDLDVVSYEIWQKLMKEASASLVKSKVKRLEEDD